MLGMDSNSPITLPNQLPVLPAEKMSHTELLEQAKSDRLDIKITRQQLVRLESRHNLIRKENGWRDMSVGINAEREFDGTTNVGPELELALPIFNRNQGKLAAIDAQKTKTRALLAQTLLDADTEIAQALNRMQSAREQLELIHSSLQIAERRVLLSNREVNFMLESPFDLLSIKRQEIQLAHDYTSELANYWRARTQLELAIGRALPVTAPAINHNSTELNNIDHSEMDHSKMNHDEMDHGSMNHADHGHKKSSTHEEPHND
jgi:outer membrane protein TolC